MPDENTTMNEQELEAEIIRLERAMLELENRRNRAFMESVLHPDFCEIGRSGRVYDRNEIIEELQTVTEIPKINIREINLQFLAKDVRLLTYLSFYSGDNAQPSRHTLRSSVWLVDGPAPLLRFHQGTAAAALVE